MVKTITLKSVSYSEFFSFKKLKHPTSFQVTDYLKCWFSVHGISAEVVMVRSIRVKNFVMKGVENLNRICGRSCKQFEKSKNKAENVQEPKLNSNFY